MEANHVDDFLNDVHPDDRRNILEHIRAHDCGETDFVNHQYRYRHPTKGWIWIWSRGRVVTRDKDNIPARIIGTDTDISELKNVEAKLEVARSQLEYESRHDSLTGLINRRKLEEEVNMLASDPDVLNGSSEFSVMQLDLDHFKQVNDTLGHAAGDAVLVHVANIVREVCSRDGIVARQGGDKFVGLFNDMTDREEMLLLGEKIIAQCAEPFFFSGALCEFGVSIGSATSATSQNVVLEVSTVMVSTI